LAAVLVGHPARMTVLAWALGAASVQAVVGPLLGAGGRSLTVGVFALVIAILAPSMPAARAGGSRAAAYVLVGKAALLAVPTSLTASGAPGPLASVGLGCAALPAARLAAGARCPRWAAAMCVALAGAAAAALDLPSGDSRAVFIALIGLVALAVSGLLPRPAGEGAALSAGALTLIGLWIGLHGHGVSTPEAYTVPLAVVLLAAGAVRYRRNPPTDSASAFGPGLAALLAPSLLVALPDPAGSTGRLLLLLPLCAAVLTLGACLRFKGPVVAGAAGVIATGLLLLVPYADAVPRWVALGLVGLLLVGIGTTYEARRRDLDRARAKLGVLH